MKEASLTFRGFECAPERVQALMGVAAGGMIAKGDLSHSGQPYPRSSVRFTVQVDGCRIDEMIPKLFTHVGGLANAIATRDAIHPELVEIDLYLPIKNSPEQENGYFHVQTIKDVAELGATIGLGIHGNEMRNP
jgi:hypothetical protein